MTASSLVCVRMLIDDDSLWIEPSDEPSFDDEVILSCNRITSSTIG